MNYKMPTAELGDLVLYYVHEGATPVPAFVSVKASRTLTLWTVGGSVKTSVHHASDPGLNEFPEWKPYGFWEHRPKDPTLSILSEKVSLMEKKLNILSPKKA